MPYLYKRIKTKTRDFVVRTKVLSYVVSGEKKRRGFRQCKTSESRAERNRRNAKLKQKYLIYNNFDVGDWWLTLTHSAEIEPEKAHKIMMYELSKIGKKLKRKGIPFVYFVKTEAGERQRAHHHLIIKNTAPGIAEMIVSAWNDGGFGRVSDQKKIYDLENGKLVSYFLDGGDHKELTFEKFSHSRNLKEPEVEKRIYPANSFREMPKAPEAEYITEGKKSYKIKYRVENLYNGFPDLDGYVFQYYELAKIREDIGDKFT